VNIVGYLFQNINTDNNIEEMATGTSYKDEVRPFATESKFRYYWNCFRKGFYLKARTLPTTTTSIPLATTGCNVE